MSSATDPEFVSPVQKVLELQAEIARLTEEQAEAKVLLSAFAELLRTSYPMTLEERKELDA